MTDDVTMGEVVRRLDNIAGQLAQITATLAANDRHYDTKFVSSANHERDLALVENKVTEANKDIDELKSDRDRQQDRNRQLVLAIIGVAVPALISIILAVLGAQGGVG